MRKRVLVSEQSLAGLHRTSAREEEARQLARSQMRDLEFAWSTFLTRGMEQGAIPQADPRLLSRAILGLYNSVWHWYRPRGSLTLEQVREFFVGRCLAVAGLPEALPVASAPAKPKRKPAKRKRAESRRPTPGPNTLPWSGPRRSDRCGRPRRGRSVEPEDLEDGDVIGQIVADLEQAIRHDSRAFRHGSRPSGCGRVRCRSSARADLGRRRFGAGSSNSSARLPARRRSGADRAHRHAGSIADRALGNQRRGPVR